MNRLELAIAWRYLRGRRGSRLLSLISTIAIGGVLVGVSALILVVSVMNGMQKDLREKILIGSPDLRVLTQGDDLIMEDWRAVLDRVKRRPGVVAAAPFVSKQTLITSGHEYADQASVMGIEPQDSGAVDVTSIRDHAIVGDFRFHTGDSTIAGAVVGKLLAERLGVYPGNTIVLMAAPGGRLNVSTMMSGGLVPNVRKFEVSGIFETGLFEYDNTYVYIPLKAAQDLAGLGDDVTGLEVRTKSRDVAAAVAADIDTTLRWPYRTQDWQNQNDSLFRALNTEKLVMSFILLLIVGVAALNIVSTLTMVVSDKTREIGILRAMGLPARSVRNVFFVQGLVIGLVGTLLGLVIGVGTAVALGRYQLIHVDPRVYLIDHLPVALQSTDVLLVALASLTIAAVATLYPAIQAAKLLPIDAIRHE